MPVTLVFRSKEDRYSNFIGQSKYKIANIELPAQGETMSQENTEPKKNIAHALLCPLCVYTRVRAYLHTHIHSTHNVRTETSTHYFTAHHGYMPIEI